MKPSKIERKILINQYALLAELVPDCKDDYEFKMEILGRGITTLYSEVFRDVSDELPDDEADFVKAVVTLYSEIYRYKAESPHADSISCHPAARFRGFDGTNESGHNLHCRFLVEHLSVSQWIRDGEYETNIHRESIPSYRSMVKKWREIGQITPKTEPADVLNVLNAFQRA